MKKIGGKARADPCWSRHVSEKYTFIFISRYDLGVICSWTASWPKLQILTSTSGPGSITPRIQQQNLEKHWNPSLLRPLKVPAFCDSTSPDGSASRRVIFVPPGSDSVPGTRVLSNSVECVTSSFDDLL